MTLQVANNAFGELNADINTSVTTIVLKSGNGARFPSLAGSQYFYATLIDTNNNLEIVKATARSSDTLTVVRAQDGTSARSFVANDRLELRPVAAFFDTYQQKETSVDMNGTELILDADADTSITADTDDQIDIKIGGADIFQMTASKLDLNGKELVLDADADTSITADTDDTIDIKIGGSDKVRIDDGGRVLIGTTDNTFATADADDLVIGNLTGHHGLAIVSNATNGYSSIHFSDANSGNGRLAGYIDYSHQYNDMTFGGGGSGDTIMKLLSNKDVKIQDGNLVIGTAGHGIDFSAQTLSSNIVGSAKSELLDHYETGQFNASVTSSSGSGTVTIYLGNPENQASRYVRIGSKVTIFGSHVVQSWGSRTGDLRISNLPFPIWAGGGYGNGVSYFPADTTDNSVSMAGGGSYVQFLKKNGSLSGGATDYWEISDLLTMKYLTYTFHYFTNIS